MSEEPTAAPGEPAAPSCYRHAERETWIRCQRCERPICPDCMNPASVGFQCPDCVKEGARTTRQPRTAYGGVRPAQAGRATLGLIGLNVLVYVLVSATGGRTSDVLRALWLLPVNPCSSGAPLGSTCPPAWRGLDSVADGAIWQLVSATFTHVELWHIGFNMLALYILGPQLEMVLGRARFLALYLLSGLTGSVTVYWLSYVYGPTVGASGAIFGLMAALLVVAVKVRGDVQALLTLVAVNVVITVLGAGYISWQGHLGGFVGGLVLALVLVYAPRKGRTTWQVAGLSAVGVLLAVAVVVRTFMLT
ncbi:MAG TPA: rhomboid family intramembrane serine protease [Marmoricola sp.]|nr:rhomboid family intramembrane serine protease [Marmoricola sp.]